MNGPAHYTEAERLLHAVEEVARECLNDDRVPDKTEDRAAQVLLLNAQVHATLALAATNVATDRDHFAAWRTVTEGTPA